MPNPFSSDVPGRPNVELLNALQVLQNAGASVPNNPLYLPSVLKVDPEQAAAIRQMAGYFNILDPMFDVKNRVGQGFTNTNCASAIQEVFDYLYTIRAKGCYLDGSGGRFLLEHPVDLPDSLTYLGDGISYNSGQRGTCFQALSGFGGKPLFRPKYAVGDSYGNLFWTGRIMNFKVMGAQDGSCTRWLDYFDPDGNPIELSDVTVIEQIHAQYFENGGMRVYGGVPLNINYYRPYCNNGPGLEIVGNGRKHTEILIRGISGDANNGGLVRLTNLSDGDVIDIDGIKAEQKEPAYFKSSDGYSSRMDAWTAGGHDGQANVVTMSGCTAGYKLKVKAGHSISAKHVGTDLVKPGDFFKLLSGVGPDILDWEKVYVRVRPEEIGTDPYMIAGIGSGADVNVPYTQESLTIQCVSGRSTGVSSLGVEASHFVGHPPVATTPVKSALGETAIYTARGTLPAFHAYETDGPVGRKWFGITHNGGNVQYRTYSDDGTSFETYQTVSRLGTGGKADAIIWKDGIKLTPGEGSSMEVGTTTGFKMGNAANQKLGFHGVTPTIMSASASQAAVTQTAAAIYGANEQAMLEALKTLVNQLRSDLVAKGLIKGSA